MESVRNIRTIVDDSRVTMRWAAVDGCDGYKIEIFNDAKLKSRFRIRYAESNRKTLLGFTNGKPYYFRITPFVKEHGKEILGVSSEVAMFSTMAQNLKINKETLVMHAGETFQLWGEQRNEIISDLDYRSLDPDIASVSAEGIVTANESGATTIIANRRMSGDGTELHIKVYVDRNEDSAIKSYDNDFVKKWGGRYVSRKKKVVISLVGDLMCTSTTQNQGYQDGRYDFSSSFVVVRRQLAESDLNIGVLETCINHTTAYEGEMKRLDNGAPNCNSPAAFLDAIKYGGFHGLVTANNHCCDAGIEGLTTTLDQISKRGLANIGCAKERNEKRYQLFDLDGLKVAIAAFNCIKNGSESSFYDANKEYMLAEYSTKTAQEIIRDAKKKSDFVIVYMHWGMMNSTQVNDSQRKIAYEIAEAGADFIVGSHPHVVQNAENIKIHNKNVPCIYSLGNFFTSMSELSLNRDGVVARIYLEEDDTLTFRYELIPTRTLYNNTYYYTVLGNDFAYIENEEVQASIKRTMLSLYPEHRSSKKLLEEITVDRLIKEMGGKPNFDIADIKNKVVWRKNVTYTNPKLPESVYFAIKINNNENPCFNEINRNILKQNSMMVVTNIEIPGLPCVLVKNVNLAYQCYAKMYRSCFDTKVIAVTGSVGKTTTKNLMMAVLSEKYVTDCTFASKNIPNAVADNILRINENTEYFVLETASSQPGQIHKSSMAGQPDACVITRIGTSHIDLMGAQQNICDTKLQVLDGASKNAPLFLNYDDPFLRNVVVENEHDIISYGIESSDVDYQAYHIRVDNDLILFDVKYDGIIIKDVKLHMHGKHNVYNALLAFAVGKWAQLEDDEIVNGLGKYHPEGHRQHVNHVNGVELILDCISADTVSAAVSYEALKEREVKGKKIVIQGHIMRMGDLSPQMHEKVGEQFVEKKLDIALCFDDDTKFMSDRINELGGKSIYFANNQYKLIKYLKENLKAGDAVLIKGADKYSHFDNIIEPVFYPSMQPTIQAIAGITLDLNTDNIVFSKNKDKRMSPASLTMIMLAILMLEKCCDRMDERIILTDKTIPYSGSNCANIHLACGEEYTIGELIRAMLVGSAFDAGSVLVKSIWGSREAAIVEMNAKAAELGMRNTNFHNTLGVYHPQHYTSAYDMALLCKYALENQMFCEMVNIVKCRIGKNGRLVKNTNRIIRDDSPFFYPYAKGIKVGNSDRAKYCMATYAEKDGKRFLNVLLGAPDAPRGKDLTKNVPDFRCSYTDCIKMFEYAFSNY